MVSKGGYTKVIRVLLVVLTLVLCFFLVHRIHYAYPHGFIEPETATLVDVDDYPFPLHNDEWAHLSVGLAIAKEKKLNFNSRASE